MTEREGARGGGGGEEAMETTTNNSMSLVARQGSHYSCCTSVMQYSYRTQHNTTHTLALHVPQSAVRQSPVVVVVAVEG